MIKKGLIALAAALAAFLIYASFRPDNFRVERSVDIQAPPEKIHALIADFHRWPEWSPYETKDPKMKRMLSGAESGVGAIYEYDGNRNVGSGRLEVTEATPEKIVIQLDFKSPMEAHNIAEFTLAPNGPITHVTWLMSGPSPYAAKLMQSIVNMDKMIGDDFAAGLAKLKGAAEK